MGTTDQTVKQMSAAVLEGQDSDLILVLEVTQREGNYLAKITYLEWTQCYVPLAS